MNFNELSLSVLARKKGCGPGFHKGTTALHSFLHQASYQMLFNEQGSYFRQRKHVEVIIWPCVSGFQGLELVPGLFVHTGLGRPPEVHSEQRQLEDGSRRPTDRCPALTTELAPQLSGEEKHPLEFYPFLLFFFWLVHIKSPRVFKIEFLQAIWACYSKGFGLLDNFYSLTEQIEAKAVSIWQLENPTV